MEVLKEKIYGYALPIGWRVTVADSSITISSPKRRQVVKMDIYRTVDIDLRKGVGTTLAVTSTRFKCTSLDHTWQVTEATLNHFFGKEAANGG
jgi:hypothetical protein